MHTSPAQVFILLVPVLVFLLSSRVFQRKFLCIDQGATSYGGFLILEVCKGSFILDHISHTSSHDTQ